MTSVKHFTLISVNYAPEDTAIGLYNTQMVRFLSEKGVDISVVTGFPYYPAWEISADYKAKPNFVEEKAESDVQILRYRQYTPAKPTFLKRIIHLLDFTIGSLFNIFKIKNTDVIFAVVPFTTAPLVGLALAKLRGAKLWIHIQDFEFDAAKESGLVDGKFKFLFKGLFAIEKWLLKKADIVSSISYAMCDKVTDKTGRHDVYYLPNWTDENDINPITAQKHTYFSGHIGKFTVLYSGNIGAKQDWDLFVSVAEALKNRDDIHFLVVGNGAYKETLMQHTKGFKNVFHYDPVAFEVLSDLLCSTDMHILFQKADVVDTVMPSKILGMYASQKPSLVTGNAKSEVAKLFEQSKAGYYVTSGKTSDCVDAILALANNDDFAKEMGINARRYILDHFSRSAILEKFTYNINQIAD